MMDAGPSLRMKKMRVPPWGLNTTPFLERIDNPSVRQTYTTLQLNNMRISSVTRTNSVSILSMLSATKLTQYQV